MVSLTAENLFDAVFYAQKYGLLEMLPSMNGKIAPGDRFFESFQKYLLETFDLEKTDTLLYRLAPTINFLADESHWAPADFTAEEMFDAVLHLQQMGFFEVIALKFDLPGAGDRFFEYYQEILVNKIGVDTLDRVLNTLGQCICFLATDESMINM